MKLIIYNVFVITSLIAATFLGIYAQDISYYLNEQLPTIELPTAITIVTFLSIGLYIIIPILLFNFKDLKKVAFKIYLIPCVLLGIPISMYSFLVWGMWMG